MENSVIRALKLFRFHEIAFLDYFLPSALECDENYCNFDSFSGLGERLEGEERTEMKDCSVDLNFTRHWRTSETTRAAAGKARNLYAESGFPRSRNIKSIKMKKANCQHAQDQQRGDFVDLA